MAGGGGGGGGETEAPNRLYNKGVGPSLFPFSSSFFTLGFTLFKSLPALNIMPQQLITCFFFSSLKLCLK